jgi:integrase
MMLPATANLQTLAGVVRVKARVQHPQVKPRKDREGWPWVFRYWHDEIQPDGTVKTLRKYQSVGPSKGDGAISKKQAEIERDNFLAKLNASSSEQAVQQIAATGVAFLSEVVKLYQAGYLARTSQIASPTREKENIVLNRYIAPHWGHLRLNQILPQAVEDWLHKTFNSWWTKHGVRAIFNRLFTYAEGHGLWEEGKRSPITKVKLGKKYHANERRILSFDETARVLALLEDPIRLVVETCIATGARISEILALQWKHVDVVSGTIKIEQRVWHQEIGRPKSDSSYRLLGIGDLSSRFRDLATLHTPKPTDWVFFQKRCPESPLWDSAVRDALHHAACAVGCDFRGFGPHSFRRANITWRQQVGGSAIEASKIAGHSDLEMTSLYTFVTPERQNELTRRIQQQLAAASQRSAEESVGTPLPPNLPPSSPPAPKTPSTTWIAVPITTTIQ